MKLNLKTREQRRKLRVRGKVYGTSERPRLAVFRSNKHIYGQLINDDLGKTLVDVSKEAVGKLKGKTKMDQAFELGQELAKKAKEKKIEQAVFDRKGYKYHGRVKMFCEGAREGGLSL